MSIAPANRASIAEGPALKLFQSILTCGPIAFSNHPLLFPTMAWECVIFGNAPTRMTLCPAQSVVARKQKQRRGERNAENDTRDKSRLVIHPRLHRQHCRLDFSLPDGLSVNGLGVRSTHRPAADQIRQSRAFQNLGRP